MVVTSMYSWRCCVHAKTFLCVHTCIFCGLSFIQYGEIEKCQIPKLTHGTPDSIQKLGLCDWLLPLPTMVLSRGTIRWPQSKSQDWVHCVNFSIYCPSPLLPTNLKLYREQSFTLTIQNFIFITWAQNIFTSHNKFLSLFHISTFKENKFIFSKKLSRRVITILLFFSSFFCK